MPTPLRPDTSESAVCRRIPADPRLLSFGQERLWYLEQLAPGSSAYNIPYLSKLRGDLDAVALEKSLNAIVERHEVLRTVILPVRGIPRALLLKRWNLEFEHIDLRRLPEPDREEEVQRQVKRQAARPFDSARDLMLRCLLIRVSDSEYAFLHTSPHLAFEGSSLKVLYRDLSLLYEALVENRVPSMPPMQIQYADFAFWQRQSLTGERLSWLTAYWKQQLRCAPSLVLPYDFQRPDVHTMRGKRHSFSIPPTSLSLAHRFFEENGVSRYCGLLAVFYVFLRCHTGMEDISVGSPFGARCAGIEDLIGFFVNTVVLRTLTSGELSFRNLLARVRQTIRDAVAHCDLTFDKVVDAVQPARDPGRNPLFQVNFRAPKEPYPALQLSGVHAERAEYVDNGTSKFDLALEVESSAGQVCYFEYCTSLFNERSVVQFVNNFEYLLNKLIREPDNPLKTVGGRNCADATEPVFWR